MEDDLYFEAIFRLLRGMPRKTHKPAVEYCIFLPRKIVGLNYQVRSATKVHVGLLQAPTTW